MWQAIKLIGLTETVDACGDHVITETSTDVMADDYSVSMAETYQAMAVGYKPEVKFLLTNWLDYHGEEVVEYVPFGWDEPIRYRVLRTYRTGDALELTCYRGVDKPAEGAT